MPTFRTKPPLGIGINWGHPFARDLAQRFLFNGRSARPVGLINAVVANPITSEARTVASAENNGSMRFGLSGSDGYLSAGTDRSTQDLALGPMTIIARLKTGASTTVGGIAERSDGNTVDRGWIFGISGGIPAARPSLGCKIVHTTTDLQLVAASALAVNAWQWVALTLNGTDVAASLGNAIYVDGVSLTLSTQTNGAGSRSSDAAYPLLIGFNSFVYQAFALNNSAFSGTLSDIAFYRRCFSAAEVQAYVAAPYAMLGQPQRRLWLFASVIAANAGDVTISAPSVDGAGTEKFTGSGSATISAPAVQGSPFVEGTGSVTIAHPDVAGTGTAAETSSHVEVGAPSLAGTGAEIIPGTGDITIGVSAISAAGGAPSLTPLWTKNRLYTAPPAATGISVTPSSTSGAWSAWFQLESATATAWLLSSLVIRPDTIGPAATAEFEVGIGAVGAEVAVGRCRGHWYTTYAASPGELPLPVLLDAIPAGRRVSIRMRKNSTSTTPWHVSATYLRKPVTGSLLTSAKPQKTYPDGASSVTITAGAGLWVNGAWTTIIASTATAWLVTGVIPAVTGTPSDWEVDLGVGATPVVITTLRFRHTGIAPVDGPTLIPLFQPLSAIPAGSKVSMRQRHGASSIGSGVIAASLLYLELPL